MKFRLVDQDSLKHQVGFTAFTTRKYVFLKALLRHHKSSSRRPTYFPMAQLTAPGCTDGGSSHGSRDRGNRNPGDTTRPHSLWIIQGYYP